MRVLVVTNMYPTERQPTAGTFVQQQVEGLARSGLDVRLLFFDRAAQGMSVYRTVASRLRAEIAHFRPDVIHVMYGGFLADLATRHAAGLPTVVSFCGSDVLGENLSGPIRKWIARQGVRASHRAARRATRIIVKSRSLIDVLPAGVDRARIAVIPNGVDLDRFRPLDAAACRRALGWPEGPFHVLFPSGIGDPVKQPWLAQAAVARLRDAGVDALFHSLSGIEHDQVPVWMNASDVVLLTSRHEGSPNIVKEALACDIPVVSVDVGDVRTRLEGIAGCHVSAPNPEALAAALREVNQGPRRVAGRSRMTDLSLEKVASQVRAWYEAARRAASPEDR